MDHQRCTYGCQAITSSLIDAHKIAPEELPKHIKCIDADDKIAITKVTLIWKGEGKGEYIAMVDPGGTTRGCSPPHSLGPFSLTLLPQMALIIDTNFANFCRQ